MEWRNIDATRSGLWGRTPKRALVTKQTEGRRIRILFVVLEMDVGGLQRVTSLLIKNLDRAVFEPYIACLDRGGVFFETTSEASAGSFILGRKPGPFDTSLFVRLLRLIRENKIDIVHSNNGGTAYAVLAGRLGGARHIVHTDHGRLVPDKWSAMLEDRLSSYLMDRFIAVSEELSYYLRETVRIPEKRLMTIFNGVDSYTFRPRANDERALLRQRLGLQDDDFVVGAVCRLDPIKDLGFVIASVPEIVRKAPRLKLLIVGDGPAKPALVRQADDLGISSTVSFLGHREDVENVIPAFDLYSCSSLSEGTSMTILEAMSCGLPIVASAVGGNLRLVDESNGILFNLGDSGKFVDAVVSLAFDTEARLRKGEQSRVRVERHFSLGGMVNRYEDLYLSLD